MRLDTLDPIRRGQEEGALPELCPRTPQCGQFYSELGDDRGPCLLLELYQLRDFYALLVNSALLPAEGIPFYGRQLVGGLTYIHKTGIRQYDLKPDNILLSSRMQLKMADFRLAEDFNPSVVSTMKAGTPGYWALEVVMEEEHTDKIVPSRSVEHRYRAIRPVDSYLDGFAPTEETKEPIARTLVFDVDQRIELPDLVAHKFHRHGFKAVPDTAFDMVRVFDNDSVERHARALENNGENPGA